MQECCRSDQQSGECSDSGSLAIVAPAASYANGFSQPRKKPRASDAFASDCACSGVNEKNRDEDLTKNATQCSIDLQIFPLIPERILSELPKPPLSKPFNAPARAWPLTTVRIPASATTQRQTSKPANLIRMH